MSLPRVAVVGTGAVARAVARRHADCGGSVVAVRSRSEEQGVALARRVGSSVGETGDEGAQGDRGGDWTRADVVVVAVRDGAIASVGTELAAELAARGGGRGPLVLHTSGAHAGAVLGGPPLRTGSLHPLQSFPLPCCDDASEGDAQLADRMVGVHWFHEGAGREVAARLVAAWGGTLHALAPGAKSLYHAAAAIVSNHSVALFDAATQILTEAGIPAADSRAPLATLLAGTARNLAAVGTPAALTGPIVRGDVAVVEQHVAALAQAAPHLVAGYVETALIAVDVAVRRGALDAETEARLRRVLVRR